MKKIVNYCLYVLAASYCTAPLHGQTVTETIDELLKAYSAQGEFNGCALVAKNGTVMLNKGYGFRNLLAKTPHDAHSIFQISSLTQEFTTAIILQMQEKKLLSVRDPIAAYLPGFPHGNEISIEDLLTHTSGIFNYTDNPEFIKRGWVKPIRTDSLAVFFRGRPLEFQPGTSYRYSNSGYVLLGYIIEKISGKPFYDVLRESILNPLHMIHTGFDFKALRDSDRALGLLSLSGNIADSSLLYAAGAMYSTTEDLYRWDRALYTNQLLQDSSLQKAFTAFIGKHGYGWVIDSTLDNKVLMYDGAILDFTSFMVRVPADHTCIILLDNNRSRGLAKIAQDIYYLLNDQAIDWPRPGEVMPVGIGTLREYTGVYRFAPDFQISVTLENGQLFVQTGKQDKVPLYAESHNLFFTKVVVTELEFSRDDSGQVNQVTLYQDGGQFQGQKVK